MNTGFFFATPISTFLFTDETEIAQLRALGDRKASQQYWVLDSVKHNYANTDRFEDLPKNFVAFAKQAVAQYFQLLGVKPNFQIHEFWFNKYAKLAGQSFHVHPGSDVSGVFYIATNGADGDLVFQHPAPSYVMAPVPAKIVRGQYAPLIQDHASFPPKVGLMVLFPPALPHGVRINTTDHERMSLAFNARAV